MSVDITATIERNKTIKLKEMVDDNLHIAFSSKMKTIGKCACRICDIKNFEITESPIPPIQHYFRYLPL